MKDLTKESAAKYPSVTFFFWTSHNKYSVIISVIFKTIFTNRNAIPFVYGVIKKVPNFRLYLNRREKIWQSEPKLNPFKNLLKDIKNPLNIRICMKLTEGIGNYKM